MTADTIVALWTLASIAAIGALVALLRVVWSAWQFRQLRREYPDAAEVAAIALYFGPEVVRLGAERHEVKRYGMHPLRGPNDEPADPDWEF